ncbi:MAG: hypothetical protein IID38_05415 [Planctomycetes bacterium]|nr:hypothetical protein [Planctomycetota bacterium]
MIHAAAKDAAAPSRRRYVSLNDLTVLRGFEPLLQRHHLDTLDALFCAQGQRLDKPGLSSWRERLRLSLDDADSPRVFYLKRFRQPPRAAQREVRRSGCRASSMAGLEWNWIARLERDGIPCMAPVAMGEDPSASREQRSAILTAAVPGVSLEMWMDQWGEPERATIRRLTAPLAGLIARLHRRGYVHRDLYLSHVFYDPSQPDDQSLHLIDLQRVMRPSLRWRRWIIKDLAALNFSAPERFVSASDRVRWLRSYLGIVKLDPTARRLVYRVVGKTLAIARHERSRRAGVAKRSSNA